LGHRPALDGLRGIAILLVLVGHAIPLSWGGPETGVTLFFVLSGFLITALLLEERRDIGRIDLLSFYRRRALRLLPALVMLLAIVYVLSELSIPHDTSYERPARNADILSTLFYYANWRLISGRLHDLGTLNHTWSLSIEEQFYFALAAGSPRRRVLARAPFATAACTRSRVRSAFRLRWVVAV
jgi:peptidoglycan/LPS O-acetylase OafA/YrhL